MRFSSFRVRWRIQMKLQYFNNLIDSRANRYSLRLRTLGLRFVHLWVKAMALMKFRWWFWKNPHLTLLLLLKGVQEAKALENWKTQSLNWRRKLTWCNLRICKWKTNWEAEHHSSLKILKLLEQIKGDRQEITEKAPFINQ